MERAEFNPPNEPRKKAAAHEGHELNRDRKEPPRNGISPPEKTLVFNHALADVDVFSPKRKEKIGSKRRLIGVKKKARCNSGNSTISFGTTPRDPQHSSAKIPIELVPNALTKSVVGWKTIVPEAKR